MLQPRGAVRSSTFNQSAGSRRYARQVQSCHITTRTSLLRRFTELCPALFSEIVFPESTASVTPDPAVARRRETKPSLPPVVPRKFVKMAAFDQETNKKDPTDARVKKEVHRMVEHFEALQEYLEQVDSALDSKVAAIRWPANGGAWGSEAGMALLMEQIAAELSTLQADSDRAVVVCGSSRVAVPTSAGQIPSNDNCPDVVFLFPEASTESKIASWKRVDKVWKRHFQRTGVHLIDHRLLDDVLIFVELKENSAKQVEARDQLFRRFYRATATKPIRQWIFGFTLCGSDLRVYIHTPTGIIRSRRIDCRTESGLGTFKRMLLRFLETNDQAFGAIAYAGSLPVKLDMTRLPPQVFPSIVRSSGSPVPAITLLNRQLVSPAMFGSRPLIYRIELQEAASDFEGGSQASFVDGQRTRPAQPHTMRLAFTCREQTRRGQLLGKIVRANPSNALRFVPNLKSTLLNEDNYWTVPPSVGRAEKAHKFVPRSLKCDIYDGPYRTVLEVESTSAMVKLHIGVVQGMQFLLGQGLLPRNFSNGSIMLSPDGQGVLTDLDDMICLTDAFAASKRRESSVGGLGFSAERGYPGDDGQTAIVQHSAWHLIESLLNVSQYVVCSRPDGPGGERHMSRDACDLWTEWNDEDSKSAIGSKAKFYDNIHITDYRRMYPVFWAGLPRLYAILDRYCCLRGPVGGNTVEHLRQQDHGMQPAQWRGRETLICFSGFSLSSTKMSLSRRGVETHEIALEPHWFRVQTERIKRCNSQAKKDY
ncbi:BZ3500_MvSof-1268-A1-R1_Chr3-3g06562 [Microbotryum saponariae]|uniref:BZ3500_MvSof-1268-A1-R1_Chr3-3g06562 protein n=1 Tax=Microbotryum saponariae TaxID=289078 RepID=A0A2X0LFD2_9BASI|nr:BZ3500_MvSof-1268-A1-R1_Chr3-3g06562 [Microbotryum saponariae]SDA04529.1 BZ3501_MvSof-1269-A2-R1_Chr3-2g06249 [Microbotryum saponariae]